MPGHRRGRERFRDLPIHTRNYHGSSSVPPEPTSRHRHRSPSVPSHRDIYGPPGSWISLLRPGLHLLVRDDFDRGSREQHVNPQSRRVEHRERRSTQIQEERTHRDRAGRMRTMEDQRRREYPVRGQHYEGNQDQLYDDDERVLEWIEDVERTERQRRYDLNRSRHQGRHEGRGHIEDHRQPIPNRRLDSHGHSMESGRPYYHRYDDDRRMLDNRQTDRWERGHCHRHGEHSRY
ncbi:hypothetical protein FHL15_000092 [Xylaria flabelliformis]|uniref:Uncharacterized protein n=1 Tax=Xylaria flabelliformis TaxID=2512241 RepID=A0A553IEZ3_9PEZI|nr:hypothetical protein FHL15_000092 [Xylaria flabelliformis]